MAGFDELIERLLYDVALSGSQGYDAVRFENAVRAYYSEKNGFRDANEEEVEQDSLFADAPPVSQITVDEKLLSAVLQWLCRHPDVELRRVNPADDLDIAGRNSLKESATAEIAHKLADKRIFTTDDRIWQAIAGHGPDFRRIPPLEFEILSIIAAHSSTGVLQPTITKMTGQDKRSVPKRTDNLQAKGYITKETVIGSTGKTSLLKLIRFSKTQSLEKPPEESAINNLKPVIHYDKMYTTMMRMLKENNGIVTMADLRYGLGFQMAHRWETKILARCVRRLAEGGCIRRVTAKMADREGEVITRVGQPVWRKAKAIQLMREPTEYDRLLWEQSDPNKKMRASDDEDDDQADTEGAADGADSSDENDDGLIEIGTMKEVGTTAQQIQAFKRQAAATDTGDTDINDLDRLEDRVPPHWNPDIPLVNILFNQINESGEGGISSTQLQSAVVGPLWKRPMDESLAHLTDIWQHSQPPHLRHLTVVRDTAVFGRSAQFKYRTLANFEKAVAAGKAVWDAVLDNTSSKAKKNPLEEKPDLDQWGFPKVAHKLLAGRDGRASLTDGRKGVLVDRMLAVGVDEDEVVVEDDEEFVPAAPRPPVVRAKAASGRSKKKSESWESTASIPRAKRKGPVSYGGLSKNGKRMGRPPKSAQFEVETPTPDDGIAKANKSPYAMRQRPSRARVPDAEICEPSVDLEDTADDEDEPPATPKSRRIPSKSPLDSRRKSPKAFEIPLAAAEGDQSGDFNTQQALDSQLAVLQDSGVLASPGSGANSRRGPGTVDDYIPFHKPRRIKEKEYAEYDLFAQKTAENRVRLELSVSRKRSADEARLGSQHIAAKRQRAIDGTMRTVPTDNGDRSQELVAMQSSELPADRVAEVKSEILRRERPGLYINPPGAKSLKAGNFVSRGRPRNAKIAVIRSVRLHELDWFHEDDSPRFAPAKPLGRRRTAKVGSALKISDDIIENSDSDAGEMNAKRQKTADTMLSEGPDNAESLDQDSGFGGELASGSGDSVRRSATPRMNQDTEVSHVGLDVAGVAESSQVLLEGESRPSHAETEESPAGNGIDKEARGITESSAPKALDPPLPVTPSITGDKAQKQPLPVPISVAAAPITPISGVNVNQGIASKSSARIKIADTTSFYLSRFAPEHRATPQQQYRLLSAKPGRKSKRDLEVLAELQKLIGSKAREPITTPKFKPTEIPDHAAFAAGTSNARYATSSPALTSQKANSAALPNEVGGVVQTPFDVQQPLSSTPEQERTSRAKIPESPPKLARNDASVASDVAPVEDAIETESSDDSETDNEDWTHLAVSSHGAPKPASKASQPTTQNPMQQAVQPLPSRAPPTAKRVATPTTSNEYFSTAYVDAHPDETFYHVGAGRWKQGMPPPDSFHETFRGPGARKVLSQRKATKSTTSNHASQSAIRQHGSVQTPANELAPRDHATPAPSRVVPELTPEAASITPRNTAPAWQASPLMIVRPYEQPRDSTTEIFTTQNEEAVLGDRTELSDEDGDEYQNLGNDDPADGTFGDDTIAEDEMDVDISEQADVEIAEVGPTRVLKSTTNKKSGPPRLGGSTQLQRHELILNAVRQCGGVFPGDSEVWYVLTTAWRKIHNRLPDKHTVERAVEQLMTEKKLKRFRFQFKSKHSAVITKQILAEPSVNAEDEIVTEMRKKMMKCYPLQYLPEEVEINEELRETASFKFGRKKAKNGDVRLSQNTATYMKRRHDEFPEDPDLVVHQTADAAARADREAQSRGFANAQAYRKHMLEVHNESKNKANLKHQEKRRKEQREAALEDAQIAAEIAAEEAELLGDAAGQIQLDNYQHDLSAAMQPRPPGYKANISQEIKFDNVLPRGKSTRPVRKTRRPLGSIRAPAPKPPRKVWWEDGRKSRELAAAHLMSPAQVFTQSNGTFGTSGQGLTQQAFNWRAAPGTLSSEQYQRETARVIAQINQGDHVSGGAVLESTAIVTLKVPKEKLDAIVSSEPRPAGPRFVDDDDGSVFEAAPTPSSVAITPEPEPEPPKKRRKYTSRKKRQADGDEAARDSDEDFVPAAAGDNPEDRRPVKLPKVKGSGARGVKKAFTTRDRQAHQDFKDVDRLVIAIALVSAIAGGVNQDKLSWNLIAHALSYRYEGEFLRRRWGHYVRSRRPDVEQLRDDIRQPFLEAYERGELPVVNFQASHETDWPALFEWVQATIPMNMSLTVDEHPDVPDLPASKELVQEKFTVEERGQVFELNKDDYFTTITDQNRRHLAQRYLLGNLLPGEIKPAENTNKDLLLAKSWVRAVAMTKQHSYNAEDAARKISVLGSKVLKQVANEMVESKMFLQDKKGRQQPGRNFQIHHEVLIQFRRWPATKDCDEHRYLCALAHSWSRINDYFKQTDALPLIPVTSDQDYTVLTNLCATGMVKCTVILPETKQEFDAPAPKLSPWGYSGTNYQTKRANQDQLKFDLVYVKTSNYRYEPELRNDIPIPLAPQVVEGDIGPRIPFWVDIHGNLVDDIWDMCLRSILHLLVFRSGERAVTMQQAHNHKLWQWEIELILHWMEQTGLARRCGEGEEINGIWTGGWTASDWWFCAFLPEMITWEPPQQSGLSELD